jgi:hypothetical protein
LSTGPVVFRIPRQGAGEFIIAAWSWSGETSKVAPMAADRAGNPGMTPQPRADTRQDCAPHEQTARFSRDDDREPGIKAWGVRPICGVYRRDTRLIIYIYIAD